MMNRCGFSIYLNDPHIYKESFIQTYAELGYTIAFTSLQIPEEHITLLQLRKIIELYKNYNIQICTDISPQSLQNLNIDNIEELYDMGIDYLRFDHALPFNSLANLDKRYKIIINASTIREEDLIRISEMKFSFNRILAMHNYYPKVHTGLSIDFVKSQNALLHLYQIEVFAFIPGFQFARGPMFAFLPTIEEHREQPALLSAMELLHEGYCDGIIIGDPLADEYTIKYLPKIMEKKFVLPVQWENKQYCSIMNYKNLHNRYDQSAETIRVLESRSEKEFMLQVEPIPYEGNIEKGSIIVSNTAYGRYCNEVEITKYQLPHDDRVNVIGKINKFYRHILTSIAGNAILYFINDYAE